MQKSDKVENFKPTAIPLKYFGKLIKQSLTECLHKNTLERPKILVDNSTFSINSKAGLC